MKRKIFDCILAYLCAAALLVMPLCAGFAEESAESSVETPAAETAAPTEQATAEPTEEASEVTEAPTAEATTEATSEATAEATSEATAEATAEATSEATAEVTSEATVEATAEATAEAVEPLSVTLSTNLLYAFANEDAIVYSVCVSGGTAPYTVRASFAVGSASETRETSLSEAGSAAISWVPTENGICTVTVEVTDADGASACAEAQIAVPANVTESASEWAASVSVRLTGDYREDLVAVALSQLGYEESTVNYIVNSDGSVSGYTRYGDWAGDPYGDWGTAFAAFCLAYADVPTSVFTRSTACVDMITAAKESEQYASRGSGYEPLSGDIAFIDTDGDGTADAAAIVEEVVYDDDGEFESISVILGDYEDSVVRADYSASSSRIIGYGILVAEEEEEEAEEEPEEEEIPEEIYITASWEGDTLGVGDTITLTAQYDGSYTITWQYMEDGETWQDAAEGLTYQFELTQENCAWLWRAHIAEGEAEDE